MATGLASIKPTTKSEKAGLKFPVSRVKSMLMPRDQISYRVSDSAAVYMAAVLEYLTAEILDLSLSAAHSGRRKRIQLIDMNVALKGYKDFARQKAVVPKSKFMAAGVLVNIDKTNRLSNASIVDSRQSIASGSQLSVSGSAGGQNLLRKRKAQSSTSIGKKTAEKKTMAEKPAKKISDDGKSEKTNRLSNASINVDLQAIASGSQMSVGGIADGQNLLGKRKAESSTSIDEETAEKKTVAEKSATKISDDGNSDLTNCLSNTSINDGSQPIASGSQMSVGGIADGQNLLGKKKAENSTNTDEETAEKETVAEKSAKKISDDGKSDLTNCLSNTSINDGSQPIASGSQMSVGGIADGQNLLGKRKVESSTSIDAETVEKKTMVEESDDEESDKNQA